MSCWVSLSERSISSPESVRPERHTVTQSKGSGRGCSCFDRLSTNGFTKFMALAQRARFLPLAPANADAPRDDHALNVRRRSRVQRGDRVTLKIFDRSLERRPALVVSQHA